MNFYDGDFAIENGKSVNFDKLVTGFIKTEDYSLIHSSVPLLCHDVFIYIADKGVLLVKRNELPESGQYWPIGGRVERGISTEESLRNKTKKESGLFLEDIQFVGCGRTFFQTDPFNHGKGTDTFNLVFFCKRSR